MTPGRCTRAWSAQPTPNTFVTLYTLLLNLTAELVGWYRISLQGLLRLYEKPLSRINAKNTTCGASILVSGATGDGLGGGGSGRTSQSRIDHWTTLILCRIVQRYLLTLRLLSTGQVPSASLRVQYF